MKPDHTFSLPSRRATAAISRHWKPALRKRATAASLVAACALAPVAARADTCEWPPSATRLTVIVDEVRSNRGLMTASIYPGDKSQYLAKNGAIKVWRVPAATPSTSMCIWLKSPGTYAVAVYQDTNSDHRPDVGPLGPTKPYGFSRNPRIFLSAPSFDNVKFEVGPGETTIHVRLHAP
jgi:uncharacterized protein (DUF2141 family)